MRIKTKTAAIHPLWFLGALALAALIPFRAHADAHSEIVTASTHAELAGSATDINGVHMHLHHALNCLAGVGGDGYDKTQMDPCANAGKGAIPDAGNDATKTALIKAASMAKTGIAEADLAKAQADAKATAAALKAVP